MNKQLDSNPLHLGDFPVKQKEYDRYLGQILHSGGVRASAEATIKDRESKTKGAIFEVKSIIDDFQMQAIGGMMAAWELWERAIVPSLLSGSGTWVGITDPEVERCDKLQDMFWRVMLEVPESCPKIALRAETRMIAMKYRIWLSKLLLHRRIAHQDLSTLSRKIMEQQKMNNWPGLAMEIKEICKQLTIPDLNENTLTAGQIKTAVYDHHDRKLVEDVGKCKKMMEHKNDNFSKVQDYMTGKSVDSCRLAFRIRCELVKEIKGNFKDKYRRKGGADAILCDDCNRKEIQTQSHCLVCPHWEEIRRGLPLDKLEGMVIFFQRMLQEKSRGRLGSV
jgi:hypothetical protein